jgi:hypothetical protein
MLNAYRMRDWQAAAAIANGLAGQANVRGLGRLIAIYEERIAEFAAKPPPADWEGLFESVSK